MTIQRVNLFLGISPQLLGVSRAAGLCCSERASELCGCRPLELALNLSHELRPAPPTQIHWPRTGKHTVSLFPRWATRMRLSNLHTAQRNASRRVSFHLAHWAPSSLDHLCAPTNACVSHANLPRALHEARPLSPQSRIVSKIIRATP